MPAFSTEVQHQLGKEQATQRLKSFLEDMRKRYEDQVSELSGSWNDNLLTFSITAYGFKIRGNLTVHDDRASLEGQLPFAAIAFRGKIENSIKSELQRELSA